MVRCAPRGRSGCWGFFFVVVVVVSTLAGLPTRSAVAQAPQPVPPAPTFELPEVVVPGKRPQPVTSTPASVVVMSRQDLERLGVITIADALQFIPEVQVRLQGGIGALSLPSIRGSSPNQVLVLIDGVPVNSVMQGLFDLSTLGTAHVERVEVLRGPFSALYGGPALGGVINVVTMSQPGAALDARMGSLSTTVASGRWSTSDGRLTVAVDRFASGGFQPNSDVASTTILGRATWETSAGDPLVLTVNHFQSSLGTPGSTAFPSPEARQNETRTVVSAGLNRILGDGRWNVRAYWWGDDFHFVDPNPAFPVDSRTVTHVFGATVQRVLNRATDSVQVFGIEGETRALEDNGPVGARQSIVGGMYVQDERQVNPRMLLAMGLRYDFQPVYGGQLNPRVGIVWVLREGLTLRAGLGRTFRGPSVSELYFAPYDNPNLLPESAWSTDVGLTWQAAGGVEVRAGLFGTAATDLIRPDASFVPQNIGHATITGGSLDVSGQFLPRVRGALNVTATRAVDDNTGEQLLRVPWFTASAALHVQLAPGTLTALVTYVGSRPDSDPATSAQITLPGYVVAGLRYALGAPDGGQLQIGVDNLADLQYEPIAGYPAPRRTVFVAFSKRY